MAVACNFRFASAYWNTRTRRPRRRHSAPGPVRASLAGLRPGERMWSPCACGQNWTTPPRSRRWAYGAAGGGRSPARVRSGRGSRCRGGGVRICRRLCRL